MDEELRFHIERQTEANIQAGMDAERARYAALRHFGGIDQIKERCRDTRGVRWIDTLLQDIRFGLRILAKNRSFTATAVLVLALGISANTAIFTVVNAVLLKPLPLVDPERLMWLREVDVRKGGAAGVSPQLFFDLRKQAQSYTELTAIQFASFELAGGEFPELTQGFRVSANLFSMLGTTPLLGRTFLPEDETPGQERVVLVGHELWQRRFNGDTNLVGKTISLNSAPFTVVGIMPPDLRFFSFANRSELWQPYVPEEHYLSEESKRQFRHLLVFGRLRPQSSLLQAQAEASAHAKRLEQEDPKWCAGMTLRVEPLRNLYFDQAAIRKSLVVLMGAVGFVLLIACMNVANLLLARASSRQREVAVRMAVGASRGRLVRQFLTESVLLAMLGAVLGVVLTHWAMSLVRPLIPETLPSGMDVSPNTFMMAFCVLSAVLVGVGFGIIPAWQSSKPKLAEALKGGGEHSVRSTGGSLFRSLLVTSEVALTAMLLIGAGLMIRSVLLLTQVDPGFEPKNLMSVNVKLPLNRYPDPAQRQDFCREIAKRAGRIPGVLAAAASFGDFGTQFLAEGHEEPVTLGITECTAGREDFLKAMRIPLLGGRYFPDDELRGREDLIIASETMARKLWPDTNPIGKRIRRYQTGTPGKEVNATWLTVIGVVKDLKRWRYTQECAAAFYRPIGQRSELSPFNVEIFVRTLKNPLALEKAIRLEVRNLDGNLPVSGIRDIEADLSKSIAAPRFYMTLLTAFAAIAVILSVVGLYGVLSYFVAQHIREIGVRVALGATRRAVLWMVVRQGLSWTAVGLALGVAAALALTRFITSQLYGVKPTDPATFAVVSLLLFLVAFLACLIPARRATKIDSMVALRLE